MQVKDITGYDTIVFGEHVGSVSRVRGVARMKTSSVEIKLDDNAEVRKAMSAKQAEDLLRSLATPGSNATADKVTLREIGAMLKMSVRAVTQINKRQSGSIDKLEGPEDFKDHDYMGSFTVGDELIVADRCHIASDAPTSLTIAALPGTWHLYIRHENLRDISGNIFAVHDEHFRVATVDGDELGTIDVDSGNVMIVDGSAKKQAAKLEEGRDDWQEGVVDDIGGFAKTVTKTGKFAVRLYRRDDRAVVVRASLAGPERAYFSTPAAKAAPTAKYAKAHATRMAAGGTAQDYSPKTLFAVGDLVTHPKFGEGVVNAVLGDGKVQIDFADGPRTLVHGR
jgi:hypothetical protein